MRENQRFRVVDTRTNKIYAESIEDNDTLFFLDQKGNLHKREEKENKIIMGPVEGYKPLFSLGIFDKDYIEIYEGDIVCDKFQEKDGTVNPYYYVAKYDKETLQYGFVDYNDDFTPLNNFCGIDTKDIAEHYEIAGNIYEDNLEKYWEIDRNWKGAE